MASQYCVACVRPRAQMWSAVSGLARERFWEEMGKRELEGAQGGLWGGGYEPGLGGDWFQGGDRCRRARQGLLGLF